MFGERLKKARKIKGYTLEEVSEIYNRAFGGGLNKGTLSKYENGKQIPMITVARDLSEILDVTTDYLLGKEEHEEAAGRGYDGFPLDEEDMTGAHHMLEMNRLYNTLQFQDVTAFDEIKDDEALMYILSMLEPEKKAVVEDVIIASWKRQLSKKHI